MKLPKKPTVIILVISLAILIIIAFSNLKLTAFAINENEETILIPGVETGEEKVYLYNKYSNNSGIIVSTPTDISCTWKPDNKDDGWKECEAIFEIEDNTNTSKILTSPEIALNFQEDEDIRNIEVSYSQEFVIEEEVYTNSVEDEIQKEVAIKISEEEVQKAEPMKSLISGMAIATSEEDEKHKNKEAKRKSRIEKVENEIGSTKGITKTTIKHQDIKFKKRKFVAFSTAPIVENTTVHNVHPLASGKNITVENATIKEKDKNEKRASSSTNQPASNISIENISQSQIQNKETKDFVLKVNLSEPEPENGLSILGNVIKLIKPKEDFQLNTNKPFAIKITFEIPKYNSNNFNFSISDNNFDAAVDPGISGCGTLNSENSIYTLDQNVESVGACFTVSATNVTIDCQGYSIRYNSAGSPAYGVYSTAASTKVNNCVILSGDLNNKGGAGVYFSETNSGEISNNTITIDDKIQEAIYLSNSENVSIDSNEIVISNNDSYAIHLSESNSLTAEGNNIISSGNTDIIYIEASGDSNITGNTLNSSDSGSYAISMEASSDFNIKNNEIFSYANAQYGIYVDYATDSTIDSNTIYTYGEGAHAIYLSAFGSGDISNNRITTLGANSDGIYLTDGTSINCSWNNISTTSNSASGIRITTNTNNNNFYKNIISTEGQESYGVKISLSSNSNTFDENNLTTASTESFAVFLSGSNENVFTNNFLQTVEEDAYGMWTYNSTDMIIQENTLSTSGASASALVVDIGRNANITGNNISTSCSACHGIEIEEFSLSNTFTENNINVSGASSSGIFFITDTTGNSFSELTINTPQENSYPIYISDSNNSFDFTSSSFNSTVDLFIANVVANGFWNFTNVSLEKGWSEEAVGFLTKMWYLDTLSTYTNTSPISNANITAWNEEGEEVFSALTDENGRLSTQSLIEYTQQRINPVVYSSVYSINASTSEETLNQLVNVSENKNITFTFSNITPVSEPVSSVSSSSGSLSGGSSSSSSSGVACTPKWECNSWEKCENGEQSRICEDKNNCSTKKEEPKMQRKCSSKVKKWDTKNTLFDININILEKNIDGLLLASIGLINLGIPGEVSANLNYTIRNSKGEIIYEEKEIVLVETQIEFIKEINLSGFPDGKYTSTVKLSYDGQTEPAQAQSDFSIGKNNSLKTVWLIILYIFLTTIIISTIFIFIKKKRRAKNKAIKTQIKKSPKNIQTNKNQDNEEIIFDTK